MQDIIISLLKLNLFPVKRLNWVFGGCFFLYVPTAPKFKVGGIQSCMLSRHFCTFSPINNFFPVLAAAEIVLQSGKGLFLLV